MEAQEWLFVKSLQGAIFSGFRSRDIPPGHLDIRTLGLDSPMGDPHGGPRGPLLKKNQISKIETWKNGASAPFFHVFIFEIC